MARASVVVAFNLPAGESGGTKADRRSDLAEYAAIADGLRREGFRVRTLNLEDDLSRLEPVFRGRDVVFNLIESFRGDSHLEFAVASLFELHGVPYTGSPPFALLVCQGKGMTKQMLLANGVPTPRYRMLDVPGLPVRDALRFPLIVKPAREDASIGVTEDAVVRTRAALARQIARVFENHGPPVLVEEYIEGREVQVSVLGNGPPRVLPILEYDFSRLPPGRPCIYGYEAKWNPSADVYRLVREVCPSRLSRRAAERVVSAALRAISITGCRDYARVDLRLSREGRPFVLEVNPNPDLSPGVSFLRAARAAGLSFSRTLRAIVEGALRRHLASGKRPQPRR